MRTSSHHQPRIREKTPTNRPRTPERTNMSVPKTYVSFLRVYQPIQEDLGYKSTYSRYVTHQGITERWNWFKIFPHEKDIQVTSQQTSNEPDGDQQLLIGGFRPDQKDLSYEVNFTTFLTHQRIFWNWNQVNTDFGLEDINFLNRMILSLPYLDSCRFRRLQTYHWRPGDVFDCLEASYNTLRCTKTHRIRRILSHLHFPYPEPSFPYSDPRGINARQIFPKSLVRLLQLKSVNIDVPRSHLYTPKLSRLKTNGYFHIWTDSIFKPLTASLFIFVRIVSLIRLLERYF